MIQTRRQILAKKSRNSARIVRNLLFFAYRDLRVNRFGQTFPLHPEILNLLVNDICNSHCQMCNIWMQKRDNEFTPTELALILNDTLFKKLKYIGVSGGEPTLRKDLPEIFRVISSKRPKISGTGIITNAIQVEDVIDRIVVSAQICREARVHFNVMVSLDGIEEVHDQVRGRTGNFRSAVKVIRHLRDNTEIPVSIGCTVTKDNVWNVDEVLDFCRTEEVYGRFRVAEFIQRLYNAAQTEYIRNFTPIEEYHLGLFFAKLENNYEKDPTIQRTYRNIRQMLMEGAERSTKCSWQATAVTLDCRGQLLYCAPKSPILGSASEHSAAKLYRANLDKRKEILNRDCASCIHDYHGEETLTEWRARIDEKLWRRRLSLNKALADARVTGDHPLNHIDPSTFRNILITGWYGTETAGDKAILGEILHQIKKNSPRACIEIASIYPYLTQWSIRELGFSDILVIPTYSRSFVEHAGIADQVIMGGGPLMHLEELGFVLSAFIRAKRHEHHTWIAGCGIGPLDQGQRYQEAVKQILRLADTIELRDSASVDYAKRLTQREDILNSGDPSLGYVHRWLAKSERPASQPILNLLLRDWTREYQGTLSEQEYRRIKARFEEQLGAWIRELCIKTGLQPRLIPMHVFYAGGDDREFNRTFSKKYLADLSPILESKPLAVSEILSALAGGRLSICMRFHSVVFAHTIQLPFIAIDYTNGGKITQFLNDRGSLVNILSVPDIAAGHWKQALDTQLKLNSRLADSEN